MPLPRMVRLLPTLLAASVAGIAASGCGAQSRSASTEAHTIPTSPSPARPGDEFVLAPVPQPLKPDLAKLDFNLSTRTLTLYELPERSGRWVLTSPTAPTGVPVDREYTFPPETFPPEENLDEVLDRFAVFYTVPNRRPSPAVSLREILDAHQIRVLR